MEHGKVDLQNLSVSNPAALSSVPLDVGLLLRNWNTTIKRAELLEALTRWTPLPLQSISHAADILTRKSVHIFVTHWHIGYDHSFNNEVTRFVESLKSKRGLPGIGSGPLLVGVWLRGSEPSDEDLVEFLAQTYDCYMELLEIGPEEFAPWLAEQLWVALPSRQRDKTPLEQSR